MTKVNLSISNPIDPLIWTAIQGGQGGTSNSAHSMLEELILNTIKMSNGKIIHEGAGGNAWIRVVEFNTIEEKQKAINLLEGSVAKWW